MALAGTLKDFSLADIFQLISFQRKTGVLTLTGTDMTVTVSVNNGTIVSADSLPKRIDDHLGQVLVRKNLITQEQLDKALEIQAQTVQRMGYILTHSNFITTEALKEALQTQILQIIFRLFRWTDGRYEFTQADSVEYDKEFITPIQIENVLMEGMRMLDEWPIISKKIPNFDIVFRPDLRPDGYVVEGSEQIDLPAFGAPSAHEAGKIKLSSNEHQIFQLVDGVRNVQAIIDRSRLTEFETCRALYDLLSRNLISEMGKPKVTRAAVMPGLTLPIAERWDYRPALTWLLCGVAAVLLATSFTRPFSVFYLLRPTLFSGTDARRAAAYVEMRRIADKVRAYYHHTHSLPSSLVSLQEADLVLAEEIIQNGQQKYDMESNETGVVLTEVGVESPMSVRVDIHMPSSMPAPSTQPSGTPRSDERPPSP